jgi:hypothetical protein
VFMGMQIIDVTCDPAEAAIRVVKRTGSSGATHLTLSSLPEMSTSQGSHWNFRLNGQCVE